MNNREFQSNGQSSGDVSSFEPLSTGLNDLDNEFRVEGVRPGTLIQVISEPNTPANIFLANMMAKRATRYYTLAQHPNQIKHNIGDVPNVKVNKTDITQVSREGLRKRVSEDQLSTIEDMSPADMMLAYLNADPFPNRVTAIIDPINQLESTADPDVYKDVLRTFHAKVANSNGVGIIHSINSAEEPDQRWISSYLSDMILTISKEISDDSVKNTLTIEKIPAQQSLVDNDSQRVYELQPGLDINISSHRNVST